MAGQAEEKKTKYLHLAANYIFTPVAIETSGVIGRQSLAFIRELGGRMEKATGDTCSLLHLVQRLSIAIQRGNAAAILGSFGSTCLEVEDSIH